MNQSIDILSSSLSSCQQLSYTVTGTLFSWQVITSYVVILISLFVVSSVYKTQLVRQTFKQTTRAQLPLFIEELRTSHGLSLTQLSVFADKRLFGATLGFWTPQIFLSTTLCKTLSSKELEAVFLHEFFHLKKRHPLKLFCLQLFSKIFFFLPVVNEIVQHVHSVYEAQADAFAWKAQKTTKHLKSALIMTLTTTSPQMGVSYFANINMHNRISSMQTQKLPRLSLSKKSVAVSLFSLTMMVLSPLYLQSYTQAQLTSSANECSLLSCASQCFLSHQSLSVTSP